MRRQSQRKGNVCRGEGLWKERKIITSNFLARDSRLEIVSTEASVNILMMVTSKLANNQTATV